MRIAIPVANDRLAAHFGHCEQFAMIEIDEENNKVTGRSDVEAPPHEPGLLPPWLAEKGVNVIIAGGMGQRALALFAQQGIKVITGAPANAPESLAELYLGGNLVTGSNLCDH